MPATPLDALDGIARAELTSAYHEALLHGPEVKELYADRAVKWDEFESIAAELNPEPTSMIRRGCACRSIEYRITPSKAG